MKVFINCYLKLRKRYWSNRERRRYACNFCNEWMDKGWNKRFLKKIGLLEIIRDTIQASSFIRAPQILATFLNGFPERPSTRHQPKSFETPSVDPSKKFLDSVITPVSERLYGSHPDRRETRDTRVHTHTHIYIYPWRTTRWEREKERS